MALGLKKILSVRAKRDADEDEKLARLEDAERRLIHMQERAHTLAKTLDDRRNRNHWRESIEQMIQGAN